jgi:hypothetical protein
MNNDIADLAITAITDHPQAHDQGLWLRHPPLYFEMHAPAAMVRGVMATVTAVRDALEGPPCGTRACLAGWVAVLTAPEDTLFCYGPLGMHMVISDLPVSIMAYATRKLEITDEQAAVLFLKTPDDQVVPVIKYLKDHPEASSREMLAEMPGRRLT